MGYAILSHLSVDVHYLTYWYKYTFHQIPVISQIRPTWDVYSFLKYLYLCPGVLKWDGTKTIVLDYLIYF